MGKAAGRNRQDVAAFKKSPAQEWAGPGDVIRKTGEGDPLLADQQRNLVIVGIDDHHLVLRHHVAIGAQLRDPLDHRLGERRDLDAVGDLCTKGQADAEVSRALAVDVAQHKAPLVGR